MYSNISFSIYLHLHGNRVRMTETEETRLIIATVDPLRTSLNEVL